MRVCYALLATATILLARSEGVSSVGQNKFAKADEVYSIQAAETASTNKRFLRNYNTEKDEERAGIGGKRIQASVVIKPNNLDQVFDMKKLDEALDPKNADRILKNKKLGGWLGKQELNKVLSGDLPTKRRVMAKWRSNGKTGEEVTTLIKNGGPAIEKKYRFVSLIYSGYAKKRLAGTKRKRGE
ncbi:Hypothetical protein PHPALM_4039 [Phytophthora palmivora]|uniref:RxLR effector protein n=1 Tax=Phytophthora palmivora TaxID=4796 RepID=A0A2P4YKU7_9STRA|nr:Hypothetical protein PHPALM_4039 [Phytophthora palmivora]